MSLYGFQVIKEDDAALEEVNESIFKAIIFHASSRR
jgi:hypothetical protein